MEVETTTRAMGTDVRIVVLGTRATADRGIDRIHELEHLWSRFRTDSDIGRLNAADGGPVTVSPETVLLLRTAAHAWRLSAGFVDVTCLPAVVAAGYDRSFDDLPAERSAPDDPGRFALDGPDDIVIDEHPIDRSAVVFCPVGTAVDPGGIGKGLAADLVASELLADGASGVLVDVGGDVRVAGASPGDAGWTISVDHPDRRVSLVGLHQGGIATSTTLRRRWTMSGSVHHHLIDPRTGHPSDSDVELATVIAGTAWEAEVLAKTLVIRGGADPFEVLDPSTPALAVTIGGAVLTSDDWQRFTHAVQPRPVTATPGLVEVV